ncbi:xanthine dehydrogenase family protein molybdopterin-binding subunit [Prosthecomicrobium sp. N25]|uniref:xanthine dehydrogenase family protein molybdopterin-binding subunit n=1 Tax=Prosthecomicrobium sp. N25 TaxID=3129254 RepID=UPI0030787802
MTALIENVSRRSFLAGTVAAGSLVLAARLPALAQDPEKPAAYGAAAMPHGVINDPRVFIAIEPDGTVRFVCHRAEMGQGVRTGLAMCAADELEADWAKVRVVQADGDEARYGNQDTDGSRSTRHFMQPMREAGAAARMMLVAAAAKRWGVPEGEVEARNSVLSHAGSGRTLSYGDVAAEAARLEPPAKDKLALKSPAEFRYIGKPLGLVDGADITTGRAQYGIDARLDGMLFAVVAHPPVYGGSVASLDDREALKVPGVVKVVPLPVPTLPSKFAPLGGVGVIARNTWAAIKGRDALRIVWTDGPNGGYDSAAYTEELRRTAAKPGTVVRKDGDAEAALARAAKRVEAEYVIPHLAQAPMEPPSALAVIRDGKCEVWCPIQAPQLARTEVAATLKMPVENVTVHVTLLGGGFGRKSKPDFVNEAALLSKAMDGAPVKVTWTREDDIRHAYFHTHSVERLEGGLDQAGKAVAWRHRSVAPTIASIFAPDQKHEAPFELGMGFVDVPFAIPDLQCENGEAAAHTRIGWFRSVSNIPHAFAIQSFAAELAAAAGRDHRDYLLDLIGPPRHIDLTGVSTIWNYGENLSIYPIDTGRLRGVVEVATEQAGWGRPRPKGRALGLAVHRSFVTYVATVVEVEIGEDGSLSVPRVDVAVDCGAWVNPDRIRSQIEGACIMGHALATLSEITFEKGAAKQSNFDSYLIPRIDQAPREIRVHLKAADYDVPPGGIGEPGVPPYAPALMNAIFAATGKRIRRLPLGDQLKA